MVVILIVSLLIGAVAVTVWTTASTRLVVARRRARLAQAEQVARGAVRLAATWLEAADRRTAMDPPGLASMRRDARCPDPDGDGEGVPWDAADPPHDVRFKEGADDAGEVFGAPDGPDSRDRYLGTAAGPDVLVQASDTRAASYLERMARVLDPSGRVAVERIAFFRARGRVSGGALATIEAVCVADLPGGVRLRARARGEVHRVDWGLADRPLVVEQDAQFIGESGWRWGEALVGGDLHAESSTWERWPSGVPWAAVDQPMRRDNDSDATADDRDGDGIADWVAWREVEGAVEDPWWRARVGGAWPGVASAPARCAAAFPFGPWREPPQKPVKEGERSGIRLACPHDSGVRAVPQAWHGLLRTGRRGVERFVEDPSRLGWFRRRGRGVPRPLTDVLPGDGGLVWLELAGTRSTPLEWTLSGERGALVVSGGALKLEGASRRYRSRVLPADLRRPLHSSGAAYLRTDPDGASADAWEIDDWFEGGEGPGRRPVQDGGTSAVHFQGIVAVEGGLRVRGGLRVSGALRARSLVLDAQSGVIQVRARHGPTPRSRWGPPAAPRTWVRNLRILR